jgi:hypothetical protein
MDITQRRQENAEATCQAIFCFYPRNDLSGFMTLSVLQTGTLEVFALDLIRTVYRQPTVDSHRYGCKELPFSAIDSQNRESS